MATKPAPLQIPLTEKIQTTFKQLSHAAVDLNTASDELSKPIYVCEAALKKLNLGIPAWAELSGHDSGGYWWDRGVGYTQLKDRWGIALRTREGNANADPANDKEELWAFNDAPRWMRLEAVAKLPELLEALLKQAEDTTQKIRKKLSQANELVDAISKVAADSTTPEQK